MSSLFASKKASVQQPKAQPAPKPATPAPETRNLGTYGGAAGGSGAMLGNNPNLTRARFLGA